MKETQLRQAISAALESVSAAIAERAPIIARQTAITEKANHLTSLKTERDAALAEVDAAVQEDSAQLAEWARNGAEGRAPAGNTKRRAEAARRLAEAERACQAIDRAIAELEKENAQCAAEFAGVQERVRQARAAALGEMLLWAADDVRALEERLEVRRAVTEGIASLALRTHGQIAGQFTTENDRRQGEWLNTHRQRIELETAKTWRELLAVIPE